MVGVDADHRRLVLHTIAQRDFDRIGSVDHVEVRDNMSLLVPDKSGAGALRHLQRIERPKISLDRRIGDEDDGPGNLVEDGHRGPFIGTDFRWRRSYRTGPSFRPLVGRPQRLTPFGGSGKLTDAKQTEP